MYILYSPNILRKIFQSIILLIVGILIVLSIIGLFTLVKTNIDTVGLKLVFSYLLTSILILFLIGFYIGCRKVFRPSYTISIDDTNAITYQKSNTVIKQFTFSDISSITEESGFCFNLKDTNAFHLPYEMKNDNVFFEKLFHDYKTIIPDEELFGELKRKNNRFLAIVIVILLLPFFLIPLLSGNVFVIFVYLMGMSLVFSLIDNTELKKINPDTIEIRKYFKTTVIPKSAVKEVKFRRRYIVLPKGGGGYKHSCELITKSNEIYTFKNSSMSSIDLYCYLTFWTNTVNQRCLAKLW